MVIINSASKGEDITLKGGSLDNLLEVSPYIVTHIYITHKHVVMWGIPNTTQQEII